jgi:hypothetical protein
LRDRILGFVQRTEVKPGLWRYTLGSGLAVGYVQETGKDADGPLGKYWWEPVKAVSQDGKVVTFTGHDTTPKEGSKYEHGRPLDQCQSLLLHQFRSRFNFLVNALATDAANIRGSGGSDRTPLKAVNAALKATNETLMALNAEMAEAIAAGDLATAAGIVARIQALNAA